MDKDIDDIRRRAGQTSVPVTDPDIQYLLDVFSGADGGGDFIMFRNFIEVMKKRASEGDTASEELVQILRRFTKMVRIGTRKK